MGQEGSKSIEHLLIKVTKCSKVNIKCNKDGILSGSGELLYQYKNIKKTYICFQIKKYKLISSYYSM